MSLPELTNLQIESKEQGDTRFGGVYCRDELPTANAMQGKWFIVNLDSHTGPGTHWVLVYNCRPELCVYFDSYGCEPPIEVKKFMVDTNKECEYNEYQLQQLGSTQCGWWCMYVAHCLNEGLQLEHVVELASHGYPTPDNYLNARFRSSSKTAARRPSARGGKTR